MSRNLKPFPFSEYPQKSILSKVPQEYIGIAKKASQVKKQRIMSEQLFNTCNKEVSAIEKINKNLQKNLNKRKKELKFVQAVRSRYIEELMQKQKLNRLREAEMNEIRNKTVQQRLQLKSRTTQSKQKMLSNKKSQSNMTKELLSNYKSLKNMEDSRILERNQSRVQQIQNDKTRIKDYYNRFYQNKNRKIMVAYKDMMNSDLERNVQYRTQMKQLEEKLLLLKDNSMRKSRILDRLDESIDQIRGSRQSMTVSRQGSSRSMTPLQILRQVNNPEKTKLKLMFSQSNLQEGIKQETK